MLIAIFISQIVVFAFLYYMKSYLNKKAENAATKEDLTNLTEIVEEVRNKYAVILERTKSRYQLRVAALDKRMDAHQKAYTTLRRLAHSRALKEEDFIELVIEAQKWWEENCLYLDERARKAFIGGVNNVSLHRDLYQAPSPRDVKQLEKLWDDIAKSIDDVVKSVELPTIKEDLNLDDMSFSRDATVDSEDLRDH